MKKYIVIIIANVLMLSCNSKSEKEIVDVTIDTDYLEEIIIKPTNFIKNSTYIQLETEENSLLGNNIEKLVVNEDKIFILDSNNKIFVFDINGAFLNTIGSKGSGPNEQLSIVSFYVHPIKKYIGVFDILKHTVFKYSFDGILLDKVKYDKSLSEFYNVVLLPENNKLILTTYNEPRNKYEYLLINESNMDLESEKFPYLATGDIAMKYGFPRIAINQNTCFVLSQYSDVIQKYNNGEFNPYLLVNTHLKSISPNIKFSDVKETGTVLDFDKDLIEKKYSLGLEQIFLTDNYLYIKYNNYEKNEIYHIFRDFPNDRNFLVTLDKGFYEYPMSGIISFENFKASSNNNLILILFSNDSFKDVDQEVIDNNKSLKKIRSNYKEDNNPIVVFVNVEKIFKDAKN